MIIGWLLWQYRRQIAAVGRAIRWVWRLFFPPPRTVHVARYADPQYEHMMRAWESDEANR